MKKIVGVSDLKVSDNINETIITYALGSCLGITAYDPIARVGGLVHVMLPLSKADRAKAKIKPAMYVDTGFALLMNSLFKMGAQKKNLEIIVAGGASMKQHQDDDYFKIGQRNFTTLRKMLWKNDMIIHKKDIGGNRSRTMELWMNDGIVTINKNPINDRKTACNTGLKVTG